MSNYHYIHVKTNVENEKKGQSYYEFKACEKARKVMYIPRMAGKIKDFILANAIETISYGDNYNGYGWADHVHRYLMTPAKVKALQALIDGKKAAEKPPKTKKQIMEAWSKRLVKLTGITMEEAMGIALEKLNAKVDQCNALIERQNNIRWSKKRYSLINKIERSNPLRRIVDREHAMNILAASYRHNCTDYDERLEEYRDQAAWGDIDYSEVKERARADVADMVSRHMEKRMAGTM